MPTVATANKTMFATREGVLDSVVLTSGLAINTITLVTTAHSNGSQITDVLFKSADAGTRNFNIIIAPTNSQANAQYSVVQVGIPASSGNNGSTGIASLAALVPSIFDIDLAGNRVITLEAGNSIYIQNTSATAGAITVTTKRRNY